MTSNYFLESCSCFDQSQVRCYLVIGQLVVGKTREQRRQVANNGLGPDHEGMRQVGKKY